MTSLYDEYRTLLRLLAAVVDKRTDNPHVFTRPMSLSDLSTLLHETIDNVDVAEARSKMGAA